MSRTSLSMSKRSIPHPEDVIWGLSGAGFRA